MSTGRSSFEISSFDQACVPRRRRPSRAARSRHASVPGVAGPSSAIGSFRSFTITRDPREGSLRYRLRCALSSLTLMSFMVRLWVHDGPLATRLAFGGDPCRSRARHLRDETSARPVPHGLQSSEQRVANVRVDVAFGARAPEELLDAV